MLHQTIGEERNAHSFVVLLTERIFEYFITRLAKSSSGCDFKHGDDDESHTKLHFTISIHLIWSRIQRCFPLSSFPSFLSIRLASFFPFLFFDFSFFFFFFFFSCFVLPFADNGIRLTNVNVFLHLNINIELFIQLVSSAHFPHGIQFEMCLLCVAHYVYYMWNAFPFDHMNLLRIHFSNGNFFSGSLAFTQRTHKFESNCHIVWKSECYWTMKHIHSGFFTLFYYFSLFRYVYSYGLRFIFC